MIFVRIMICFGHSRFNTFIVHYGFFRNRGSGEAPVFACRDYYEEALLICPFHYIKMTFRYMWVIAGTEGSEIE